MTACLAFGQCWSAPWKGTGQPIIRIQDLRNQAACIQQDSGINTVRIQCAYIDLSSYELLQNILDGVKVSQPDLLIMLNIVHSNISNIPSDTFKGYALTELALNYNQLTQLPRRHLNSVDSGKLSVLNLSDNLITEISSTDLDDFPFLDTLSILDLSRNLLTTISPHTFDAFANLATLNLQKNAIKSLAPRALSGLWNLHDLNLSFNLISYIDQTALPKPSQLMVLLLNDNRLQFLEEDTFSMQSFSDLRDLALEDNPFYCNCSLVWLKNFLNSCQQTYDSEATCSYPVNAPFYEVDFCSQAAK